ncbi:hypothetical protein BDM02DRAFT_3119725 [Thelephora ganbajun]|uniref:Uncharacterized protein n=1 Tax=Thelephora ganbajun TaxID=370292 RepID=A0ACB6Z8Q4_THEGA|nr:hypothetical protein BDM02DRAFT_3119725 [Thelephora ganbajun]
MSHECFDTTDSDVVLRSADGQEFRAHKTMLSIASPVFQNMFTFPQPPSPEPPSAPIVDVCETGEVLDVFLQCIYPVSKPTVKGFELLEALVAAADKYETEVILDMVGSWLVAPENLRRDPLRVYAIACSSPALREQVKVAAKWMTFEMVVNAHWDTVARLTATDHHRLVLYLVNREKEAKRITDDPSWAIFYTPRCACKTEAKVQIKEEIKKALTDAFVSNPSLSMEGAVVLAYKQLSKVRACSLDQNCSLVIQGEEYAKELMGQLADMSDTLWC